MTRASSLLALVLLGAAVPTVAYAKGGDAVAAEALFVQGRDAMKRDDYAAACPRFAESQRLDPAVGTVLNLAQCEEKLGKLASEWQHYREAADPLSAGDPRIQVARTGLAAVERRVPKLIVRLPADAPADTTVTRDGVELGAASLGTALPVDPGEHVMRTRAPGRQEAVQRVLIVEGKTVEVLAKIGRAGAVEPSAARVPPATPSPVEPVHANAHIDTASASPMKTIGYVAGALGLIGIGAGTWFAMDTENKASDAAGACGPNGTDEQLCINKNDAARRSHANSKWTFIGGGVALAGGIALVLAAPADRASAPSVGLVLRTRPTPGNDGLGIGGTW